MYPNISFNSPPVSRSSGLSRPRLVKERKQKSLQNLKSTGNAEFRVGLGSGFGRSGNDTYVFGGSNFDLEANLNSGKLNTNEAIGKGVFEEVRKNWRIESENEPENDNRRSFSFDDNASFEQPEDMKESNTKGYQGNETYFSSDAKNESKSFLLGGENREGSAKKSFENELPSSLKEKLTIEGDEDADNGSVKCNADDTKKFVARDSARLCSDLQLEVGNTNHASFETNVGFSFASKREGVGSGTPIMEFKTSNPKGNPFSGLNKNSRFSAKAEPVRDSKPRKKGKLKQPIKIQMHLRQDFVSSKSTFLRNSEASESFSSADFSSHQELQRDSQDSMESDSQTTVLNDTLDDETVSATQDMCINQQEVISGDTNEEGSCSHSDTRVESEDPVEEYVFGSDTESLKPAFVNLVDNKISSRSEHDRKEQYGWTEFGFSSNSEVAGSNFTFAASSPTARGPLSASKHNSKRKNSIKAVHDSNAKDPYASPLSAKFSPFTGVQSLLSAQTNKSDMHSSPCMGGNDNMVQKEHDVKQESSVISFDAAQDACEQWRLRGNGAYADGDLPKAEECYTQGINCISKNETSKSCPRTLMLSYSNRAAARMSLGRTIEALGDCMMAASIDPNFYRVQVRAANCYLALGEVENASMYFKQCLQSGSNACVDRKILVEASEGLEKAQKVSESMHLSAELLSQRTWGDAEKALEVISEALLTSPYSEKFLEMKADALFTLRKYEEVIKLCEQTFDMAEKNFLPFDAKGLLADPNGPEIPKDSSFRIWRCCFIFKSYFHLGKLEEAVTSLEKHEASPVTKRDEGKTLRSFIPLAATVCELLRLKAAGNEAFKSGKHEEAVEHYTAALSFNVQCRPFTAVCLGNRAAAYKALGQIVDAIADCSLAIALDGNYVKAISRRATLFEMIRDYWQAATDLQRLAALLAKQIGEEINKSGAYDRSSNLANDLRKSRLRLSEIEGEARKGILLDMYLILGVEPCASASDIRKAYRKAALRHHPDKAGQSLSRNDNGDDRLWKEIGEEVYKDADKLFKMIGEAYAVLSDPSKRSKYDLEEEARKQQKKHEGSSTPRGYADSAHNSYPFERSGAARQQSREVRRSYSSSFSKGSEATRSNRHQL